MPADEEDAPTLNDDNSSDKTSAPASPLLTGTDFRVGESLDRRAFWYWRAVESGTGVLGSKLLLLASLRDESGFSRGVGSVGAGCGGCCRLKAFLGEDSSR